MPATVTFQKQTEKVCAVHHKNGFCRTKQINNLFVNIVGATLMAEEKANIQELARKVEDLVNVLNAISADLTSVVKSLKGATGTSVPSSAPVSAPVTAPAPSPAAVSAPRKAGTVNEVKQAFSPDLVAMLLFDERENFFIVKPRRFLGSDNFAKIASVVRGLGGEYVSSGKNSHFKIPKQ
jgi:hypothetical protein